jgi:AcrR family transcriptional regulator
MSQAATIDPAQADELLLSVADQLFFARGTGDVSMVEIRDRSGVSLRRLYSLYPSKSDLVTAWLRHRHEKWMAGFAGQVEDRLSHGDLPVDAIFNALEGWMTETVFRGCGFINTHAESNELTDAQRSIIRDHKRSLGAYLDTLVPRGAAVAVIVDGAIVQASIFASPEPIRLARLAAQALTAWEPS